ENHGTLSFGGNLETVDGSGTFINTGTMTAAGEVIELRSILNSGLIDIQTAYFRLATSLGTVNTGSIQGVAGTGLSIWGDLGSPGSLEVDGLEVYYHNAVRVAGSFRAGRIGIGGDAQLLLTGPVANLGQVTVYTRGVLDLTEAQLAPAARTLASLNLAGGTLITDDDLTVTGAFTWAGDLVGANGTGSLTAA